MNALVLIGALLLYGPVEAREFGYAWEWYWMVPQCLGWALMLYAISEHTRPKDPRI